MQRCITIYSSNIAEIVNHNFDETPFFLFEGEFVDKGFDVVPSESYEFPKKFPSCCKWHSGLLANYLEWFARFPYCCEQHQELSRKVWFRKEDFNGLPFKIVKNISFTTHHIYIKINDDNWYKEITDYIEYNLASFGSPALGSNLYLKHLKHYLKYAKLSFLSKEKRRKILEYIESQTATTALAPVDLNLLYKTFQTWVNALPNLTIFSDFKNKYAGNIPSDFLFYSVEYNPYLMETKLRARTRKQLIRLLIGYTKEELSKVDSVLLLENNTISDIYKHQFDIAGGKRKLKQDALLGKYSKGELKYVDVMREWLINEEEYFSSVTSLLESPSVLPQLSRISKTESISSTHINNNFTLEGNSMVQMIQGDRAVQNNISGDNIRADVSANS